MTYCDPNTIKIQILEPSNPIGSNIARTSKTTYHYGWTNPQEYYVYSANTNHKLDKKSFYDATNLSDSILRVMTQYVDDKSWEATNTLYQKNRQITQNQIQDWVTVM